MTSRLKNLLTLSLLGLAACTGRHTGPKQAEAKKADTVPAESQKVNLAKKFPRTGISRVVSYSFQDTEEDFFEDSLNRGQLLQIMPDFQRYLRKNDHRPKVILNKAQTTALLSIIRDHKTYKLGSAMCYNPRNLFCFYNDRDEIVAWYEICFECGKFDARPEFTDTLKDIGLSQRGSDKLDKFCRSAGITIK